MTPEQVNHVQRTFALIPPGGEGMAALFYRRLFELDPTLRLLFRGDMKAQGRKLMQVLGFVIGSLNHPDRLVPAVQSLGRRHRQYGVRPGHYATVGAALLWTLKHTLGGAFTPAVCTAWTAAYTLLAEVMQAAAEEEGARAA